MLTRAVEIQMVRAYQLRVDAVTDLAGELEVDFL